jgi:protein-tyrosine-phosphatase
MNVLFICRANAIRSQIAEALYNHHVTDGKAVSAGVDLVNSIQGDDMNVPTMVCGLTDEFGVDASCQKRDWLTEDMVRSADVVVVMTDYQLPNYVQNAKKLVDWSDVPDIVSSGKEEQVRVCEEINRRVQDLLTE